MKLLSALLDELPDDLLRQVFTHASWSERRGDSYARLAFLGDSVLGLAVTTHLYPRLEAERFGPRGRAGQCGGAGGDRAGARLGDRGGDRCLLPARRLRAHRRGGGG